MARPPKWRLTPKLTKCGPTVGYSPASRRKFCRWLNATLCIDPSMRSALLHRPAGHWPKSEATDACTLDFEARHRRRARLISDRGEELILNLPKAIAMAE